jgi:hypothetical protein
MAAPWYAGLRSGQLTAIVVGRFAVEPGTGHSTSARTTARRAGDQRTPLRSGAIRWRSAICAVILVPRRFCCFSADELPICAALPHRSLTVSDLIE